MDEVISGYNDGWDFAVDKALDSIFPGLIETDTVDVLPNVHSGRRLADLEHGAFHKISWTETVERSSVLGECAKQRLAVFFVRPDEEIQVFRRSRLGMHAESIAPTMRYLTACSLKARNSSFRSLGIINRNSPESGGEAIGSFAGIPNGREPISDGQTLPVAIDFRLLLLGVCNPANCLVRAHDLGPVLGRFLKRKGNRRKTAGSLFLPASIIASNGWLSIAWVCSISFMVKGLGTSSYRLSPALAVPSMPRLPGATDFPSAHVDSAPDLALQGLLGLERFRRPKHRIPPLCRTQTQPLGAGKTSFL